MTFDHYGKCFVGVTVGAIESGELLHVEDWKAGVKRLHIRYMNPPMLRIAYCREHILTEFYSLKYYEADA